MLHVCAEISLPSPVPKYRSGVFCKFGPIMYLLLTDTYPVAITESGGKGEKIGFY